MVSLVQPQVEAWLAVDGRVTSADARFVYAAWLEGVPGPRQRRFYDETLAWISAYVDEEMSVNLLAPWLDQRLEFAPVRDACFKAVHRGRDSPQGTYILKHIVRRRDLPDDVIRDAPEWCDRHAAHRDTINRFGPLLNRRISSVVGLPRLVRIATRVLRRADLAAIASDSAMVAATRATIATLFGIGRHYPRAELVARISLVAALRDGRLFNAPTATQHGPRTLLFDQKMAIAGGLLSVMGQHELDPANSPIDYFAISCFCDWVGQWHRDEERLEKLRAVAQELTDRFGLPDLWRRMVPLRTVAGTYGSVIAE